MTPNPGTIFKTKERSDYHRKRNRDGSNTGEILIIQQNEIAELVSTKLEVFDWLCWLPRRNAYSFFAIGELTLIYSNGETE